MTKTNSILQDAHDIVASRDKGYGDPVDTSEKIATAFTALTGRVIFPKDVALIQVLYKLIRSEHDYKRDNMIDAAGYVWIRERCLLKEKEEAKKADYRAIFRQE